MQIDENSSQKAKQTALFISWLHKWEVQAILPMYLLDIRSVLKFAVLHNTNEFQYIHFLYKFYINNFFRYFFSNPIYLYLFVFFFQVHPISGYCVSFWCKCEQLCGGVCFVVELQAKGGAVGSGAVLGEAGCHSWPSSIPSCLSYFSSMLGPEEEKE